MICIFCDNENTAKSEEHIVPESFGNKIYIMPKGKVCDECNQRFSDFEGNALANSVFAMERARYGIVTKKGKNVKGKVNELIIEGDEKFRKYILNIKGLNEKNIRNYDPKTRTGELIIQTFDKSEVATSKLLLKMALESINFSQKKIFEKYDFTELKDFLLLRNNKDWPFMTTDFELQKFTSVPRFSTKHYLKTKLHCELKFLEFDDKTLLFKFKFGGIAMTINLLNRDLDWIKKMPKKDGVESVYPEHYRRKISK